MFQIKKEEFSNLELDVINAIEKYLTMFSNNKGTGVAKKESGSIVLIKTNMGDRCEIIIRFEVDIHKTSICINNFSVPETANGKKLAVGIITTINRVAITHQIDIFVDSTASDKLRNWLLHNNCKDMGVKGIYIDKKEWHRKHRKYGIAATNISKGQKDKSPYICFCVDEVDLKVMCDTLKHLGFANITPFYGSLFIPYKECTWEYVQEHKI